VYSVIVLSVCVFLCSWVPGGGGAAAGVRSHPDHPQQVAQRLGRGGGTWRPSARRLHLRYFFI